jgi:hypothetical protein
MKKFKLLALAASFFIAGCQDVKPQKAKFIDSEVEGVEYLCAGLRKITDKDGNIYCEHTPFAMKIGEIVLGNMEKLPSDGILLPQDLVGASRNDLNNENVKKLIILLQSLDADKNPSNGITITKEIRDNLKAKVVFLKDLTLEELKSFVESQLGDIDFVDEEQATNHLKRSMKKYGFNIKQNEDF